MKNHSALFPSLPVSILTFLLLVRPSLCSPIYDTTTTLSEENPASIDVVENASLHAIDRQGWTGEPVGRGTTSIIWSCCFTMFLCSWSTLCVNVPSPRDSIFKILRRKVYLTCLALLGPEFIFQIAFAQWESARQSVKDFEASGIKDWTMTHAFYADMGGFVLKPKDWVPFPINAKQLHYLVTKGYVCAPNIDKREIQDKNKVDGMLRFITLCQTLWFIVTICGRSAQHLAITTAELTTAAFILCSCATTLCWYHKPADIQTPEIIETEATVKQILKDAKDQAQKPFSRTPLDFVTRKEWAWSLYWSNWVNILRKMHIIITPMSRPVDRFQNTIVSEPSKFGYRLSLALSFAYGAIFVTAWDYSFPTRAEQILWRASSTAVLACMFCFWAVGEFAFSLWPSVIEPFWNSKVRQRNVDMEGMEDMEDMNGASSSQQPTTTTTTTITTTTTTWAAWTAAFRQRAKRIANRIRNNSAERDPELAVPLKAILPIYVLGVVYCHARAYIFLEDIIELRSLPASAYATVNWSNFFPHI